MNQNTKEIDGKSFLTALRNAYVCLSQNKQVVNDLNVFPIPDGDTGDNMAMTLNGGVMAVANENDGEVGELAQRVAQGMLMGARGNSGVILSQFFAGIADGFNNLTSVNFANFVQALKMGVQRAYSAVIKPTEGTILTVAREGVDNAVQRFNENTTLSDALDIIYMEMSKSLEHTPELLAVLKEAGVVDSGGAGLLYIFDGMRQATQGNVLEMSHQENGKQTVQMPSREIFNENSQMNYGYCTEFLLQLFTSKTDIAYFSLDKVKEHLQTMGDSIVAFLTGTVLKVHIHTFKPGDVFNYIQQFGEFVTLKVENMTIQHNNKELQDKPKSQKVQKRKKYGVVTVASGEGICQTFYDLGVDFVIDGMQTKNPSTEQFLKAFEEVNAEIIFVLPNNGNIFLTAEQAGKMYKNSCVKVVDNKTIGEGYAIMSMLSFESNDVDTILAEMQQSMQGVVTCQVAKAVCDAQLNGVAIKTGDYVGFEGKRMLVSNADKVETAMQMLQKFEAGKKDVVIVIYGNDVDELQRQNLQTQINQQFKTTELFEIDGGQEVYDFIIILE